MQQQNAIIIRSGSSQNWALSGSSQNFYANAFSLRHQLHCRAILARSGLSLINSYYYRLNEDLYSLVLVYYRFYQRSKLRRFLSKMLRRGDAVLADPFIRFFLHRRLNKLSKFNYMFLNPTKSKKMMKKRRRSRRTTLCKLWKRNKMLWCRNKELRGWGDMELLYFAPLILLNRKTLVYRIRKAVYGLFGERVHVSLYDINQFVPLVNPILFSSYYVFNRFKRYLYLYDLIQLIGLSSKLSLSNLIGQTLAIGIERHETRKIQRRFLKVFTRITDRMVSWELIIRKPLDWRISIFGRLDAQIRRQHLRMQIGRTSYQVFDLLTSYSLNTAKSKFSTSSVRVWMRNLSHWS